MKPSVFAALVVAALATPILGAPQPVQPTDAVPGLVGQYFQKVNKFDVLTSTKDKPFLVRVDKAIHFDSTEGQFYNSKLAVNFGVKWNGLLKIDQPGEYTLTTKADD